MSATRSSNTTSNTAAPRRISFTAIAADAAASIDTVLAHYLPGGTWDGDEYEALNPTRSDASPGSFRISREGHWADFATDDTGKDLIALVAYLRGCRQGEAARELADLLDSPAGVSSAAPKPAKRTPPAGSSSAPKSGKAGAKAGKKAGHRAPWEREVAARYDYTDEQGTVLGQVVKFADSDGPRFIQRRPAPHLRSGWEWKRPERTVPYRLPDIERAKSAQKTLVIAEGEKDVDNIRAHLRLFATCNAEGAGKWRDEHAAAVAGAHAVVILPDNDDTGRAHAHAVARTLYGKVGSIRILHLPGLPPKGDVSDWIEAGGTSTRLRELAMQVPGWEPGDDAAHPHGSGSGGGGGGSGPGTPEADDRPPEYSDEALTLAFTARHAHELRYTAMWGKWSVWADTHWRVDSTLHVYDKARALCRDQAQALEADLLAQGASPNSARTVASAKTVAAVEKLARADRAHAATVEQWDAHPWRLNALPGVVDLHTGELAPHDPHDYHAKLAPVEAARSLADAPDCHLWHAFLDRITNNDAELKAFLQRMAGYALTGVFTDHALFFLYGTGRNGKSTFVETLTGIMGTYARVAHMEAFTVTKGEQHPTDLAGLQGARLVTATETEEGKRWSEAKIKTLTGGERITARFMRGDFFDYQPVFKLIISGNHKPALRNVDTAIRERFHLVPFTAYIDPTERIPDLKERLRDEWPGILAWMVEGCLAWQRGGLAPPAAVREATEAYMNSEDALARWMEDECMVGPEFQAKSSFLFESWSKWAEANREYVGTSKSLTQQLENRGFERMRTRSFRGFRGIGVRSQTEEGERYGERGERGSNGGNGPQGHQGHHGDPAGIEF